jgi:hypothetical protein
MRGTIVTARTANFRRAAAMGGLALACSLVFTTSGPIARSAHAEESATGQLVVVFSGLENDRGTAGIALMTMRSVGAAISKLASSKLGGPKRPMASFENPKDSFG